MLVVARLVRRMLRGGPAPRSLKTAAYDRWSGITGSVLESHIADSVLWKRSSAASDLDRRRRVGQVHCVGHRHEHLARSLEALPSVRGADVVHKEKVAALPPLACCVSLIHLIDHLDHIRADRVAVANAGIEGQPVLAVRS